MTLVFLRCHSQEEYKDYAEPVQTGLAGNILDIPHDISTCFARYLYSTKRGWIIRRIIVFLDEYVDPLLVKYGEKINK